MPSIKKFVQIDKVFHKCNNTNGVEHENKDPKFKFGDKVRIPK